MSQPSPTTPSPFILNGSGNKLRSSDEIFAPIDNRGLTLQQRLEAQDEWIETSDGEKFSLAKPVFKPEVIAHSLGMCVRFNGHVRYFYSVAEHCALVSMLMARYYGGDPFEGLMHDGLESILSDVPSPIKRLLPDYKEIDDHLDRQLRKQFGLPEKKSPECKRADRVALFIEAHYLIPSGGANYQDPNGDREEALKIINETGLKISCLPPDVASKLWLTIFEKQQAERAPRIVMP